MSAPQRRVLSSFTAGASAGMKTVAVLPTLAAAQATAWPWLPEECVTRPAARCRSVRRSVALVAPRSLNDPVRCSGSGLTTTVAPVRASNRALRSMGVRTIRPAMRSLAASTSS